jgi:hypothetical protein
MAIKAAKTKGTTISLASFIPAKTMNNDAITTKLLVIPDNEDTTFPYINCVKPVINTGI